MKIDKDNWCGSPLILTGLKDLEISKLINISIDIQNDLGVREQLSFENFALYYDVWNRIDPHFGFMLDTYRDLEYISYNDLELKFLNRLVEIKSNSLSKNKLFDMIYEKYYNKIILL